MSTITIDGKSYKLDTLSEEAKAQLTSIQVVDQKIANLNAELAIMQTARNAYALALSSLLPKTSKK
jgi:cell division protein ZapA (FtsZ GTPase activity inhibitor)